LINKVVLLSKFYKQLILILLDSISIVFAFLTSFFIRYGYFYLPEGYVVWLILVSPIIAIPIFIQFGLYRSILRYIGYNTLWRTVKAITLYALLLGVIVFMLEIEDVPRSVVLINWLLSLLMIIGSRVILRWLLTSREFVNVTNVIIYGAGSAGIQLSIALKQSNVQNPVFFIDDDAALHGRVIHGMDIISFDQLEYFYKKNNIKEVLLALPSITRMRRNEIFEALEPYHLLVRSVPGVNELAQGKVKIQDLHDIQIKDLLGRESVAPIDLLLQINVFEKVVMVTGAGGSIGSELCRQIILLKPKILIMFDHSEFALYSIDSELSSIKFGGARLIPIMGSVNNSDRLKKILRKFEVDTIYHAAAYKHVPMVEFNITEGVVNNIFGTLTCAQAAIDENVKTFVLISTDKAVRPTNTMGASKRFSELILQALSKVQSHTKFTIVRFGNVLGSSGSVIPVFREQIKRGGPITVTDQKMERYFMTIPEAVELVIQSGSMGKGGDVFVLDMGDPVSIDLLARKMVQLSGLKVKDSKRVNGDIEIVYTGLRPGEKLFEELLIGDNVTKTKHSMISCAQEEMIEWDKLQLIMDGLMDAVQNSDYKELRSILIKSIPGYKPQGEIVDFLHNENS